MSINPCVYIDILALYVIILVIRNMHRFNRGDKTSRLFTLLLSVTALNAMADAACWLLDMWVFPGSRELIIAFSSLMFILQALYCQLWLRYEILWIYGRIQMNPRLWTALSLIPLCVIIALVIDNLWTQSLFVVDANCYYCHGKNYQIALAAVSLYVLWGLIILLVGTVRADRDGNAEQHRNCVGMLRFTLLQLIGTVSDVFELDFTLMPSLLAFGLLMVYLDIQQRAATRQQLIIAEQDKELTESRVAVMLSQIQPHFLYNSLTAIARLCDLDPAKAKKTTLDFSDYLRGNLDSLSQKKPVLFSSELRHTQIYTDIEKIRFGDKLNVEYEIEAADFLIPSLTVQPLVENAVKYGVGKKKEGGTVRVTAREDTDGWHVTVTDDGVGFDPNEIQHDGRTHIGIDNVRRRLALQCGGTLTIETTLNIGTTSEIFIPRGGEACDDSLRR